MAPVKKTFAKMNNYTEEKFGFISLEYSATILL